MKRETIEALIASYIFTQQSRVEREEFRGDRQELEEAPLPKKAKTNRLSHSKSDRGFPTVGSNKKASDRDNSPVREFLHQNKFRDRDVVNFESTPATKVSFETYAAREEYRRLLEIEADYKLLKEQLAIAETLNVSIEQAEAYQEEFSRYQSTKEQATKLLCNYLNPRRDIDCDEEIIEIIDLFFQAIISRIKCLNISPQQLEADLSEEAWQEESEDLLETTSIEA